MCRQVRSLSGKHRYDLTGSEDVPVGRGRQGTTHSAHKQQSSEAVICGEKLLSFIPPAEIHFSKEIVSWYCCYKQSESLTQPLPTTSLTSWVILVMHGE